MQEDWKEKNKNKLPVSQMIGLWVTALLYILNFI